MNCSGWKYYILPLLQNTSFTPIYTHWPNWNTRFFPKEFYHWFKELDSACCKLVTEIRLGSGPKPRTTGIQVHEFKQLLQ